MEGLWQPFFFAGNVKKNPGNLFCPEKPGPLGLRLVEPTPRKARSEFSGSA